VRTPRCEGRGSPFPPPAADRTIPQLQGPQVSSQVPGEQVDAVPHLWRPVLQSKQQVSPLGQQTKAVGVKQSLVESA
jgi:hypothetical protein